MNNHIDKSEIIKPDQLSDEAIQCWEDIIQTNKSLSSPFFSYYFSLAAYLSGRDVRICILYVGSKPVAFIPLQYKNKINLLLAVADRVGNNLNDYFGIIATEGFNINQDELLKYCNLNYFGFSHLRDSQTKYGLKGENPIPSPIVNFEIDDYQLNSKQRRKKNHFTKETDRRLERAKNELGTIHFEFATKNIESELNQCIKVKRAQYKNTNSPDPLKEKHEQKLLSILSGYNYDTCTGVLSTLYAGDTWLASHFGLISKREMHYWFPVYNPEYLEYSAGRILIVKMIEEARNKGLKLFDFGAGSSQMKRKFANDEVNVLKGVWRNNSLSAFTYQAALSSIWKYRSLIRKINS